MRPTSRSVGCFEVPTASTDIVQRSIDPRDTGVVELLVTERRADVTRGAVPLAAEVLQELFYIAPDGKMMAVPIKGGPAFEPGVPVPLFDTTGSPASISERQVDFAV